MKSTTLARWEGRWRPFLTRLPPRVAVAIYSRGRRRFLETFGREVPGESWEPVGLDREVWGLRFRSPIANAAGMFKRGEGYEVAARQGAGAYLAGTTTHRPRPGNRAHGTALPFVPYPRSGAASNWLGLPNPGHRAVAERLAALPRVAGFPIGASVAAAGEDADDEQERLRLEAEGLRHYEEAGVDFLEVNESCPNTADDAAGFDELSARLAYLAEHYLARRGRSLPVVVKFSCDTPPARVPDLVDLLAGLGFDGVNFGNTSTAYGDLRSAVAGADRGLYDHFTRVFRGGLSGRPLKELSLVLARAAVEHLRRRPPEQEFHVVRTGGIESAADLERSKEAGVSLNQWFSGYFEAFARHGHAVYRRL